ncbi:MAG: phosphoserine transaminase [Alphaproteobacteria bacterium]|nr:MAG: phosphoserine transaminase [Alphaproteobacteria bacterium]
MTKPRRRPARPHFSSGPCAKRPGWTPDFLAKAPLGRSHRSKVGKARLKAAIERTHAILGLPDDWLVGIVPASDTGAVEMALWNLLGSRGIDVLAFESFSKGWASDIRDHLKIPDTRVLSAPYGELPDLDAVDPAHDLVFCWNGTTSGVRVPNGEFIAADREGLAICDATSAVFAQPLAFDRLDVVTFSWQKVLGGEAAHGMLLLSPRAVERIETYDPPWPLPKIFRLKKKGVLNRAIFEGATINTPSMLCVEDYLDALDWADAIGGLGALHARADENAAVLDEWVRRTEWIDHLVADPTIRSNTSICLKIVDPAFAALDEAAQRDFVKQMTGLLENEGVAFDIAGYRDAPPGLRIWCGATVEADDIAALCPWLDWAFAQLRAENDRQGRA